MQLNQRTLSFSVFLIFYSILWTMIILKDLINSGLFVILLLIIIASLAVFATYPIHGKSNAEKNNR